MSNYRDGLFYSYFGLSGPGGPMVSDIIFTQSLLTIRLGLVLTWSHGLCNFVSLSSLLNLVLVSLGLMVSLSHILLSFILSWPYQNIFWTQWTHWSHDVFLVSWFWVKYLPIKHGWTQWTHWSHDVFLVTWFWIKYLPINHGWTHWTHWSHDVFLVLTLTIGHNQIY